MPCIHAYTHTHTHTCTLTLFAYERGFPIDQNVYACMLMFGKCIPFILETLFRYEEKGKRRKGERERANPSEEEIQCKYGSAIGAKLSTSRVCRLFERCCCLRWPRARQGERRSEMGRRSGGTERRIFSIEALFLLLLLRYTVLSLFTNSTRRT